MIWMITALTIAVTGFCIAGLIAPLQAEIAVQSNSALLRQISVQVRLRPASGNSQTKSTRTATTSRKAVEIMLPSNFRMATTSPLA